MLLVLAVKYRWANYTVIMKFIINFRQDAWFSPFFLLRRENINIKHLDIPKRLKSLSCSVIPQMVTPENSANVIELISSLCFLIRILRFFPKNLNMMSIELGTLSK